MPTTIKLRKPLEGHNGVITKLELRDLTARDLAKFRTHPVRIYNDGRVEIDYDLGMKFLEELSGVDDATLGDLTAFDFKTAIEAIVGNLTDSGIEPPSSTT